MCKKEIGTLQHFKKLQNIWLFFLQGILSCRFDSQLPLGLVDSLH